MSITPDDRLDAQLAALVTADTSQLCQYVQHRAAFAVADLFDGPMSFGGVAL